MPFYKAKPPFAHLDIRRQHPFARNIAFATLLNDPFAPVDLVTRKVGTLTSGMNPRSNSPYGRAVSFPGTSTDRIDWVGMPPPIVGSGRCTIAVLANPLSEARTNCLVSQRNAGSNQISLYVNTNNSFGTEAGSLFLSQDDSIAIIHSARATGVVSGGWSWYIITSEGGVASSNTRYYVDGVLRATLSNLASGGVAGTQGETFSLGAPSNYTGGGYTHNKEIDTAFVWNDRVFSDAEVHQFLADPWVWLGEPDLEVWPVSAGGPVNGVLASSGSAAAAFTGGALAAAALSGAASSTAAWSNGAIAAGAFSALGQGAGGFTGSALARGQYSAPGSAAAAWSSAALAGAVLNAPGVAAGNFVSNAGGIASAVFSSLGASAGAFSGSALARASLATAGSATGLFTGSALAAGAFTAAGASTFTALSVAVASGTFTVLGQGAAAFAGSSLAGSSAVLSATGSSTAAWSSAALAASAFSAPGASLGAFVAPFTGAGSILDGKRKLFVVPETRILKAHLK